MLTNKNSGIAGWSTALALSLLWLGAGCQPNGPESLLRGEQYLKEGKVTQAVQVLERAAQILPQDARAWNHLGLAYHRAGQTKKAVEAYQQALRLNKTFLPARFNLGVLCLEQNLVPEAISHFSACVTLQPNHADGWKQLGAALIRARRPDEAERALLNAQKLDPKSAEVQNNLGMAHAMRKRPREALLAFNAALQLEPRHRPALLNQAIVLHQAFGNKAAALERYRLALANVPASQSNELRRVVAQIEGELYPKPDPKPTAPAPTSIAQTATDRTNLALVTQTSTNPPSAPPPPVEKPTNAAASLKQPSSVTTNSPRPSAGTTNLAGVTSPPEQTSAAKPNTVPTQGKTERDAKVSASKSPSTPSPSKTTPDPEPEPTPIVEVVRVDTEPQVRIASETPPKTPQPRSEGTNSPPAAQEEEKPLFAARKRDDENKPEWVEKVNPLRWFRGEDKPKQTPPPVRATTPTPAVQLGASAPRPRVIQRYSYRKNFTPTPGDRTTAERFFSQGAQAHVERRWPAAIEAYRNAIASDPSYFEAYYNLGLAAYQSKDLPLALAANEQAVALKPSSADARYNFAISLREANYYQDAANELRELLVESPDEVRAHYALGNIYAFYLDEPFLAQRHYTRVLELQPNHPESATLRQWLASRP